jgi:hypothetical protein
MRVHTHPAREAEEKKGVSRKKGEQLEPQKRKQKEEGKGKKLV